MILARKVLSHAGIADKDCSISLGNELQIEQSQDTRLQIHAALVVFELEAVDGMLGVQARETEAALNGAAVAGFQLEIHK